VKTKNVNLGVKIIMIIALFTLFSFPSTYPAHAAESTSIKNLRCEYRINPQGIDVLKPRLSWGMVSEQRGQRQTAYLIIVATTLANLDKDIGDTWDSGKIFSSNTTHIHYEGKPLKSDHHYYWKVRVWDKDGQKSEWSTPAFWSTGLLKETDWKAQWIGLDQAVGEEKPDSVQRRLSARLLRTEFKIMKNVKRATAFICGLGLFELYLNGEKIGDQVLSPGLTEYNKRAFYMTFDVTKQLKRKDNAVGVILGNGRYFAPRTGKPTNTRTYGYPKLLTQINIHFSDGTSTTVVSDNKWKLFTEGPIRANNEYDGEIYDARKEIDHWNQADFDDSSWQNAALVSRPGEKLVAQMNEPIKVMKTIQPVAISEVKPGIFVFDMGQNMVGWVKLHVQGKRGTQVFLKFAEVLRDDGMLFMDNIRGAKVTDIYTLKSGETATWEPRFIYHGFRYVEIRGFPGTPDLSTIEGRVVYDAVENTGTFSCSNDLINKIYSNAIWGIIGNYRSIPTDCPQRDERQGWLGDRSVESKGESYIFDISKLYNKWLIDIQDAQRESGSIPDVAPSYWPFYNDNTTWPGSYIIIPAMLYDQYGDLNTIQRHYPSMKKWIEYMSQYLDDGIMPKDNYGDWCVPPEDLTLIHTNDPMRTTSGEYIGTAYFFYELQLMARFANLLDKPSEAERFQDLAQKMKQAFNEKFLDTDNIQYGNNSQTSSILALAFDLVPDGYRDKIFENLVAKILGESEGHVGTGLIGCQWLMRILTANDRADIAYTLASQNTYPSWGYMVEQGATTIWELWNGDKGDPGMNSHNHVMLLGDLITWFYENLAGIKPDPDNPGFKHIVMHPEVTGQLNFVKASYRSINGLIKSEWQMGNNEFHWDISLPANTTATVFVPADPEGIVYESGRLAPESPGVRVVRREKNRTVYEIESGQYTFTSDRFNIQKFVPYVASPEISPADSFVTIPAEILVNIKCKTTAAEIHYTLDGQEVNESAPRYEHPFQIAKNTTVKAKAYKKDFHPSMEKSVVYDFIDPTRNSIKWELYTGAFTHLPDFEKLKPAKSGNTYQISLKGLEIPAQNFALVFSGYIQIDHGGEFFFYTNSNDGSQLFINNKRVVDNDGEHGAKEMSGRIHLDAGRHPIKVTYFQSGGSKVVSAYYKGPVIERKMIPGSVLYLNDLDN
jgi:alpha-L-rhamnosidase